MSAPAQGNWILMIFSICGTALFWGIYGPLLLWGHKAMEVKDAAENGRLRPFICVGVAYLIIAIVGPMVIIEGTGMERGRGLMYGWNFTGVSWSLLAGGAGALGAFFLLLALNYHGGPTAPLVVMPLVFGCAPVVNTMFTMTVNKKWAELNPFFAAGLILVAVGAVTVLIAAPRPGPPKKPTPDSGSTEKSEKTTTPLEGKEKSTEKEASEKKEEAPGDESK